LLQLQSALRPADLLAGDNIINWSRERHNAALGRDNHWSPPYLRRRPADAEQAHHFSGSTSFLQLSAPAKSEENRAKTSSTATETSSTANHVNALSPAARIAHERRLWKTHKDQMQKVRDAENEKERERAADFKESERESTAKRFWPAFWRFWSRFCRFHSRFPPGVGENATKIPQKTCRNPAEETGFWGPG